MVAFPKLLVLAVSALSGLVAAHPLEVVKRQAASAPAADPTLIDDQGIYARVTRLNDGSLLSGFTTLQDGNTYLRASRSTDGGNSWQRVGIVDQGPSGQRDIDNAFPLALPDGRILYAFRNHDKGPDGSYTYYRITVCVSTDGGASWAFLAHINDHAAAGVNGLWEPFLRIARDGSIQAYYSSENAGNDQDNIMQVSRDGGASWGPIIGVSGGDVVSRDGMTGVSQAPNGDLICVFENTEIGRFSVNLVRSTDDGLTWGGRSRVYTPAEGREAGAPQIVTVGNTLVTSFMSNEDGGDVNGNSGVDNGEMRIVTSTDNGQTWSGASIVSGIGSHWPGMFAFDGSSWLALYSFNGRGLLSQKWSV